MFFPFEAPVEVAGGRDEMTSTLNLQVDDDAFISGAFFGL